MRLLLAWFLKTNIVRKGQDQTSNLRSLRHKCSMVIGNSNGVNAPVALTGTLRVLSLLLLSVNTHNLVNCPCRNVFLPKSNSHLSWWELKQTNKFEDQSHQNNLKNTFEDQNCSQLKVITMFFSLQGTYQLAHQWFPKMQASHLLAASVARKPKRNPGTDFVRRPNHLNPKKGGFKR